MTSRSAGAGAPGAGATANSSELDRTATAGGGPTSTSSTRGNCTDTMFVAGGPAAPHLGYNNHTASSTSTSLVNDGNLYHREAGGAGAPVSSSTNGPQLHVHQHQHRPCDMVDVSDPMTSTQGVLFDHVSTCSVVAPHQELLAPHHHPYNTASTGGGRERDFFGTNLHPARGRTAGSAFGNMNNHVASIIPAPAGADYYTRSSCSVVHPSAGGTSAATATTSAASAGNAAFLGRSSSGAAYKYNNYPNHLQPPPRSSGRAAGDLLRDHPSSNPAMDWFYHRIEVLGNEQLQNWDQGFDIMELELEVLKKQKRKASSKDAISSCGPPAAEKDDKSSITATDGAMTRIHPSAGEEMNKPLQSRRNGEDELQTGPTSCTSGASSCAVEVDQAANKTTSTGNAASTAQNHSTTTGCSTTSSSSASCSTAGCQTKPTSSTTTTTTTKAEFFKLLPFLHRRTEQCGFEALDRYEGNPKLQQIRQTYRIKNIGVNPHFAHLFRDLGLVDNQQIKQFVKKFVKDPGSGLILRNQTRICTRAQLLQAVTGQRATMTNGEEFAGKVRILLSVYGSFALKHLPQKWNKFFGSCSSSDSSSTCAAAAASAASPATRPGAPTTDVVSESFSATSTASYAEALRQVMAENEENGGSSSSSSSSSQDVDEQVVDQKSKLQLPVHNGITTSKNKGDEKQDLLTSGANEDTTKFNNKDDSTTKQVLCADRDEWQFVKALLEKELRGVVRFISRHPASGSFADGSSGAARGMKRKTQERVLAEEDVAEKEDAKSKHDAGRSKTQVEEHVRTINNSAEVVEIQELLLEETGANSVSADAVTPDEIELGKELPWADEVLQWLEKN
ncbi:unnamed protein product [Amoebophrya sp. A120]|nr:unnamed protein product [Amoebophrya sp. A120]|eukprot:GSA120T00019216001.1